MSEHLEARHADILSAKELLLDRRDALQAQIEKLDRDYDSLEQQRRLLANMLDQRKRYHIKVTRTHESYYDVFAKSEDEAREIVDTLIADNSYTTSEFDDWYDVCEFQLNTTIDVLNVTELSD